LKVYISLVFLMVYITIDRRIQCGVLG
jgi:hypothetical protein